MRMALSRSDDQGLTRRRVLTRAAAAALSTVGLYELVDRLSAPPARSLTSARLRPEQHVLVGQRVVTDDGVAVIVPPLHHQVVTAKLRVEQNRRSLLAAKAELEQAL